MLPNHGGIIGVVLGGEFLQPRLLLMERSGTWLAIEGMGRLREHRTWGALLRGVP